MYGETFASMALAPEWRVAEQPSSSETQDFFLNAITATTTTVGSAPTTAPISGTGLVGVLYTNTAGYDVAIFGTNPAGVTSLSYTAAHSGTAQHVVAGLSTGTASIKQGGTTIATAAVGADGSVGFTETGGGLFALTVASICAITTSGLPGGTVGTAYSQTISTSNCAAPVTWTVSSGSLCTGLSLGSSTGTVSGTPTADQTCSFTVQVVDSILTTITQPLSVAIAPSRTGTIITGARFTGSPIIH
jgi:hypothetical protein